jgi:hypothetical protein
MHESMARALKEHKQRVLIRAWELRQLEHAKGAWFRLRHALALSEAVYAIDEDAARSLEQKGYGSLPVGREFSPPKRLFVVAAGQLSSELASRPLRIRLDAALLGERNLVLVPWQPIEAEPP